MIENGTYTVGYTQEVKENLEKHAVDFKNQMTENVKETYLKDIINKYGSDATEGISIKDIEVVRVDSTSVTITIEVKTNFQLKIDNES